LLTWRPAVWRGSAFGGVKRTQANLPGKEIELRSNAKAIFQLTPYDYNTNVLTIHNMKTYIIA